MMRALGSRGVIDFDKARDAIWKRTDSYIPQMSRSIATAFKMGDPFPTHFEFGGRRFQLLLPRGMMKRPKANKHVSGFVIDMLTNMLNEGERDGLALLAIALSTAGKIPHWSTVPENMHPNDMWDFVDLDEHKGTRRARKTPIS